MAIASTRIVVSIAVGCLGLLQLATNAAAVEEVRDRVLLKNIREAIVGLKFNCPELFAAYTFGTPNEYGTPYVASCMMGSRTFQYYVTVLPTSIRVITLDEFKRRNGLH